MSAPRLDDSSRLRVRLAHLGLTIGLALGLLAACTSDADTARHNLDTAAEQFEVARRIVFINGITDEYLLEVVGFCSYEAEAAQVVLICRNPDGTILKHSMIRSDNVTSVVEQLEGVDADTFRPRIIFKPESLLPDIDIETQAEQDAEASEQPQGQG